MSFCANVVSAFVACGVFGPLAWMAFDRTAPFEVIGSNPNPHFIRPGDLLDLGLVVKSSGRTGCTSTFERSIESAGAADEIRNSVVYEPRPSGYASLPEGTHQMHTTNPMVWPPNASIKKGPAVVSVVFKVRCNFIHTWWPITVRYDGVRVEVL